MKRRTTVYLPDSVIKKLRRLSRRAGVGQLGKRRQYSVSAVIALLDRLLEVLITHWGEIEVLTEWLGVGADVVMASILERGIGEMMWAYEEVQSAIEGEGDDEVHHTPEG